MKSDSHYQPLLSEVSSEELALKDKESYGEPDVAPKRHSMVLWVVITLQSSLIVVLFALAVLRNLPDCPVNPVYPQVLYCIALSRSQKMFNVRSYLS